MQHTSKDDFSTSVYSIFSSQTVELLLTSIGQQLYFRQPVFQLSQREMNKVKYKCSVKTQTTALKAPTHAGLGAFKVRKFSVRKESLPSRLNTAFQEVAGHPLTLSKVIPSVLTKITHVI